MEAPTTIGQIHDAALLPQRVVEHLRCMIIEGKLKPGTRLPPEPEFAKSLNVSRSTLRVALDRLAQDGFIERKRGIGTFVADRPLVINNLNVNNGVTDLIFSIGAKPGTLDLKVSMETADLRIAQSLEVELDSPVMTIERIRTADERRVVFMRDWFSQALLDRHPKQITVQDVKQYLDKHHSIYRFLREELNYELDHAVARLRPVTADSFLAEKLGVPKGSGLLYFEQIDSDKNGKPIITSDEYHVAGAFTFTVFRT
jgi:GntR family transcriptional regulator